MIKLLIAVHVLMYKPKIILFYIMIYLELLLFDFNSKPQRCLKTKIKYLSNVYYFKNNRFNLFQVYNMQLCFRLDFVRNPLQLN